MAVYARAKDRADAGGAREAERFKRARDREAEGRDGPHRDRDHRDRDGPHAVGGPEPRRVGARIYF